MGIYGTCWYQVWEGVRSPRILTLLILYFQFIFLCKEILKIRVFNGFYLNLLSINVSLLGSWVMKERICEDFRGATFVNIGWSHGFLSFGLSFSPSFFHWFHLVPISFLLFSFHPDFLPLSFLPSYCSSCSLFPVFLSFLLCFVLSFLCVCLSTLAYLGIPRTSDEWWAARCKSCCKGMLDLGIG